MLPMLMFREQKAVERCVIVFLFIYRADVSVCFLCVLMSSRGGEG